jgi:hypothetical protein
MQDALDRGDRATARQIHDQIFSEVLQHAPSDPVEA